jgi:hypothetical protein
MNYENFKSGFNKPTIITGQQYGTKISVELDHSDTELDELMDAFETLVIGLGYHPDSWKQWIVDRADEYKNDDKELENRPHFDWDEQAANERMDIIGQNGNDGTHYFKDSEGFEWGDEPEDDYIVSLEQDEDRYAATQEDEDEFDDYGMRIPPNKVLIDAKKQYDEQIKKENKKKKDDNKKKKRNTKG